VTVAGDRYEVVVVGGGQASPRGSALLGWVKEDAEHLAGQIAQRAGRAKVPSAVPPAS
jgi:hypothetical protein